MARWTMLALWLKAIANARPLGNLEWYAINPINRPRNIYLSLTRRNTHLYTLIYHDSDKDGRAIPRLLARSGSGIPLLLRESRGQGERLPLSTPKLSGVNVGSLALYNAKDLLSGHHSTDTL
ncbi:hypothetical protein N7495_007393 [Penicillium taxi]|uniref:uncharacterized protein n=1 Tax=Penicillium taxi TaxID=168475 RepID=UPI0025456553|nr:uncharacterized protein N7495_007393 [Penicillium taxi]KAJ5887352.1 hypothetical protein N7495_007393 [Penicillium taxi]